jgi:Secretion system C-terminal sorting domain
MRTLLRAFTVFLVANMMVFLSFGDNSELCQTKPIKKVPSIENVNPDEVYTIYTTNFDDLGEWTIINGGNGDAQWGLLDTVNYNSVDMLETAPFMWADVCDALPGETLDEWLISPTISPINYEYVHISFDLEYGSEIGNYNDSGALQICVDGENWILVQTFNESQSSYPEIVDISEHIIANESLKIAFQFSNGYNPNAYMGIDNVRIYCYSSELVVSPSTLSISLDLSEPSATGSVQLENNTSVDQEYSAYIRLTENTTPENILSSQNGPVVDELWDEIISIDTENILNNNTLCGCFITTDGIYLNSWEPPSTLIKLDHNLHDYTVTEFDGLLLWNEMAYDQMSGLVYTVSNDGELLRFDPEDVTNSLITIGQLDQMWFGLAYDYDNEIFYWANPNMSTFGSYDAANTITDIIDLPVSENIFPSSVMYMSEDPNGYTIWVAVSDLTDVKIYKYSPDMGEWSDEICTLPFSGQQMPVGWLGLLGLEATDAWTPGNLDIVVAHASDNGHQVTIYEGIPTGGNCDWMTVEPAEGAVPANGSIDLTVTAFNNGMLSPSQTYTTELRVISGSGSVSSTFVELICIADVDEDSEFPIEYELHQNYPNPFNPTTTIVYDLKKRQNVQLSIYNMLGKEVAELTHSQMGAGSHSIEFDASSLSSGIYFYQIKTDEFTAMKKMILIK